MAEFQIETGIPVGATIELTKALYEVVNGWMGESYVRVYVWAESEQEAKRMAIEAFEKAGEYNETQIAITRLFDESAAPFVTEPSDSGWEMP